MTIGAYLGLLGLAMVLALTPGPNTLLALRYAVRDRRSAIAASTGSSVTAFAWAALAATGIAALLRASHFAYEVLTLAGGGYLAFVGVRAICLARFRPGGLMAADRKETGGRSRGPFLAGVGTSLANPKTGLFFLAVFPQFVPSGASPLFVTVVLGGTVSAVLYAYQVSLTLALGAASRWLARPCVIAVIEAGSGLIFTVLGGIVAVTAAVSLLGGHAIPGL